MATMAETDTSDGLAGFMLRLRAKGVMDTKVMKALETASHANFLPVAYFGQAWQDASFPISCGQTMPSPDVTAQMVNLLMPEPSSSVLEIGTGSGFQAAVLASLCKKVHSVDRYQTLVDAASDKVKRLGMNNVVFSKADGNALPKSTGLYDRIIADVAYREMPRHLLDIMTSGGIVVTAIGEPNKEQTLVRLIKIGSRFEREDMFKVRFGGFEEGSAGAI